MLKGPLAAFVIVICGLLLITYINRKKIKVYLQQRKTCKCLEKLGLDQIMQLHCPDGLGHHLIIDRIVMLDHAILIIKYMQFPGKIFGSESIDQWTQMLPSQSHKFPNPLYALNIQIQSLSKCLPNIPIEGRVFFDATAEFPKGFPDKIIHPDHMEKRLFANNRHSVSDKILQAWHQLKKMQDQAPAE